MNQYRQFRFASLGWRGILGLIVAGAVAVAAIVLLLGLALVLVPIVAIAVLIGRWRLQTMQRAAVDAERGRQRREDEAAGVIDGEFTVVDRDAPKIR